MKWYEYPLLLLGGFVILVLTLILIGFVFFKFFVFLFILGLIVLVGSSIAYFWTLFQDKKESSFLDEMSDELMSLKTKLHSSKSHE